VGAVRGAQQIRDWSNRFPAGPCVPPVKERTSFRILDHSSATLNLSYKTSGAQPVGQEIFGQPHAKRTTPAARYFRTAIGAAANIVLKSIDTCAPKAPNFGVPDENVFK
jgi:hypothetical protein